MLVGVVVIPGVSVGVAVWVGLWGVGEMVGVDVLVCCSGVWVTVGVIVSTVGVALMVATGVAVGVTGVGELVIVGSGVGVIVGVATPMVILPFATVTANGLPAALESNALVSVRGCCPGL